MQNPKKVLALLALAAVMLVWGLSMETKETPVHFGSRDATFTLEGGEEMEGGLHFASPFDAPAADWPQLQLAADKPRVVFSVYPVTSRLEPLQYRLPR